MKSFKLWLAESESISSTKTVSHEDCFGLIRDAIQLRNSSLNPASLIDATVGIETKAFLYLEDTNLLIVGPPRSYHMDVILKAKDYGENNKTIDDLRRLYYGLSGGSSPMGVVGRIAYGIYYTNLKNYISHDLRVDLEREDMQGLKNKMKEMDIVALYKSKSGSKTDENVRKCLNKLEQDGYIKNKDRTILLNENKVTMLGTIEQDYAPPSSVEKKEEPSLDQKKSRELSRKFIPKPETFRQAASQAGIPMGDWTNYGRKIT